MDSPPDIKISLDEIEKCINPPINLESKKIDIEPDNLESKQIEIKTEHTPPENISRKRTRKQIIDDIKEIYKINGTPPPSNKQFKTTKKNLLKQQLADLLQEGIASHAINKEKLVKEINEETKLNISSAEISFGALGLYQFNRFCCDMVARLNNKYQKNDALKIDRIAMDKNLTDSRELLMSAYKKIYEDNREIMEKLMSPMYIVIMSNVRIMAQSLNMVNSKLSDEDHSKFDPSNSSK